MEELEALRKLVEEHDYTAALLLLDEMDEMAKEDKVSKIRAFLRVLLVHLIKQHAEKRSTPSWENSIDHALDSISDINQRSKSKGLHMEPSELAAAIDEKFPTALRHASREAFAGAFDTHQLTRMIDPKIIKQQALDLILTYDPKN
ncbi:MAG: DUF29 domain-containing protein [Cytophagaceae bacterium]|nr:DUF29 domain-containing protein [Cytophagaceae bacterium]